MKAGSRTRQNGSSMMEVLVTMVGGKVVYESASWTNLKATGTN